MWYDTMWVGQNQPSFRAGGGEELINLHFQGSSRAFDCLPAHVLDYPEDVGNRVLRLVDPNLSARRHIPEDRNLHHCRCGNPKSRGKPIVCRTTAK